jgi:hypothetical protein
VQGELVASDDDTDTGQSEQHHFRQGGIAQPEGTVDRRLIRRVLAFRHESRVYEMRRGSSDMGFNQPFGQNQQWNRDQEAGVGGEVGQEGDAYVVPDRQSLRRGEHEEQDPGQEHGERRSPGQMG